MNSGAFFPVNRINNGFVIINFIKVHVWTLPPGIYLYTTTDIMRVFCIASSHTLEEVIPIYLGADKQLYLTFIGGVYEYNKSPGLINEIVIQGRNVFEEYDIKASTYL